MELLDEITLLRQQGHRLTPQRLQVLQVIKAAGRHITAEELHAEIVQSQPFIDIATVYRSLQWLQGVGLVAPIDLGDSKLLYEYRAPGDFHHHLVCQGCGYQIQISDEELAPLKDAIQKRYGFDIQIDHLALPGRCSQCADFEEES